MTKGEALFLLATLAGVFIYLSDDRPQAEAIGDENVIDSTVGAAKRELTKLVGTPYDDLIQASADMAGLEYGLLWRLLYRESHFREDIINGTTKSPVGALGIAQFMPATAVEQLGSVAAALDPGQAIPGAARYLAALIRSTGSVDAGVAAYNWGIGNVKRKGLANAPKETVDYVEAITGTDITQG